VFAVTVTAYHWLLDGIVATGLVAVAMALGVALQPVAARWRPPRLAVLPAEPPPIAWASRGSGGVALPAEAEGDPTGGRWRPGASG